MKIIYSLNIDFNLKLLLLITKTENWRKNVKKIRKLWNAYEYSQGKRTTKSYPCKTKWSQFHYNIYFESSFHSRRGFFSNRIFAGGWTVSSLYLYQCKFGPSQLRLRLMLVPYTFLLDSSHKFHQFPWSKCISLAILRSVSVFF